MRRVRSFCLLAAVCAAGGLGAGDDASPAAADKQALSALQPYVGAWRGVGQPKRGSNAGAWTERADWAWEFADDAAAVVFAAPEGKVFVAGKLVRGEEEGTYEFLGTPPDSETAERFRGRVNDDDRLVLEAVEEPAVGRPARVSFRLVAEGDRLLVLYEKRRAGGDSFARLAEVGYTRQGSGFGRGGGGPECVVTGGYGSMSVEYMGQTYYLCCTGCRDLFNEDPAGVLAEYRERKRKEREERDAE